MGLLALRTDHPHEPLGEHRHHARGHEVGRHAHVDHAGDGAGGVVGVERAKHKMPRERRLDAHLRRLRVAHLADEDHVGRLPQHGPNDAGEVEPDLVLDLHLVDAGEVILHRVFGRDDLRVGPIELVERGVERGRLAGARGAGDENDAVGPADQVLKKAEVLLGEAELADADLDVVFVEHPHHDRLPVVGGQHADAEVVVFAIGRELDASVLRPAAFGDIEFREDLDARKDGTQQPSRRVVAFDETTVYAVADADPVFEGLDVDVAGPQLNRLGDDEAAELDDRRIRRFLCGSRGGLFHGRFGEVDRRVGEFLEHRVGALAVGEAVVAIDRLHDLLPRGEAHLDVAVEDEAELLLQFHVGGVARGQSKGAAHFGEREDRVFTGHALGEQFDHILRHGHASEVDDLQPVGLAEDIHHLVGWGVAELDDLVVHLRAGCARHAGRLRQLLGTDDPLGNQEFGKRVGDGHG